MFSEVPFADVPFSALGGELIQVTVNGFSMALQIGCFDVSAWSEIPDTAATWSSIMPATTSWSSISVTTNIWEEVC